MTTKTAWAHLPNAKHIDAVLADVKARPEAWTTARGAAGVTAWDAAWAAAGDAAQDAARDVAQGAARDAARDAARYAVWNAAWDAARTAARNEAWDVAWGAVWGAIRAIIAWDSAADLLECTPDVLRAMIDLAEPPVCHQAALLLPYAIVRMHA